MVFYQIQSRRDTSANWVVANPILGQGELGLELDTDKWKVGDGSTIWTSLPYIDAGLAARMTAAEADIVALQAGSGSADGSFWPHSYGATGLGVADDTAALQACFNAADAVGGRVALWGPLGQHLYRITGPVTFGKGSYIGFGSNEGATGGTIGSVIICDSATARVNVGTWTGNKNPSYVANIVIDGNNSGDPTGIARLQCESSTLVDVVTKSGDGHGFVFDHAQNNTLINIKSSEHHFGVGMLMDNGAGGNTFIGGHNVDNENGIRFDHDNADPPGSQFTYGNEFYHMVIETYLTNVTNNLIEADSGLANRFIGCQLGANADPTLDLALVKVISGVDLPQLEFDSCWFTGHNTAVDHAIDITGTSTASVVVSGFTTALNVASLVHTNSAQAAITLDGDRRMIPSNTPILSKSGAGSYAFTSVNRPPLITEYTTAQTDTAYSVPAGAKYLRMVCVAGGGGGGSGRRGAAASTRCGGGGGGGGGYVEFSAPAIQLGDTLYVTVGAGGTGGAAQTVDDTNGITGTAGGSSYIAVNASPTVASLVVSSLGGGAGVQGVANSGFGGGQGISAFSGGNGGSASTTGGTGVGPTVAGAGGAGQGGGAGGGVTSGNVDAAGGAGFPPIGRWNTTTAAGGGAGGVNGTPGTSVTFTVSTGSGGGGGGGNDAGVGGTGGAGGRASGGGGGGASLNGNNSGAGGAGGIGYVIITAVF